MRAAVYKGNNKLAVEDIPVPEVGPKDVLVDVAFCAICGTDVHGVMYDVVPPGTVLGHEYSGTIVEVGSDITKWKVGDRVVGGGGDPPPGKGKGWDLDPRYNYRTQGLHAKKTLGYAEFVRMEEWEPIPIPDGVSEKAAALCEPAAVAVHAVRMSQLKLGDSVAVIGAGPIGLFTIQAARAAGATNILVSEPSATRRAAAEKLGADIIIDPTQENAIEASVKMTNGMGVHVAFDCAGIKGTLDQSASMVRPRGQAVLIAVPWEPLPIVAADWMARHINIQTTFGQQPDDWHTVLRLMQMGKIVVEPMLQESDFVPLEDIQSAFESLFKPSDQLQMIVRL
jgi:(R,R)-butanediol dehydrogenase/meso-butanediol dehydrogenase/diacetyl reductase